MPIAFAIAYTGNSLYGASGYIYFPVADSIDPMLVSGVLGMTGFLLGSWIGETNIGKPRTALMVLIVAVSSAPVAYALAYTGNWLQGEPIQFLFQDSIDSLLVGAPMCALSFLVGIFIGRRR